jgi:hypothetical protein
LSYENTEAKATAVFPKVHDEIPIKNAKNKTNE